MRMARYMSLWLACLGQSGSLVAQAASVRADEFSAFVLPTASRENVSERHFGVETHDPYRWMEDTKAAPTRTWMTEADQRTRAFVARWPERDGARLAIERGNVAAGVRAPIKEGGRYFVSRMRGSGPTLELSLLVRDTRTAAPRVVLDNEALRTAEALTVRSAVPAPDGRLVAYAVAAGGARAEQVRVREVDSGRDRTDRLAGVDGLTALVWARRGPPGFFYTRVGENAPAAMAGTASHPRPARIMYHRIGTPQSDDALIFARPDHPEWVLQTKVSDDGRFLVVLTSVGVDRRNRVYYADLAAAHPQVRPLTEEGDAEFVFVGSAGRTLWLQTDLDAPRGRVVAVDVDAPVRARWRVLIPQGVDAIDSWIGTRAIGTRLLVTYRKDAVLMARVFDLSGRPLYTLSLPQRYNSIWSLTGRQDDPEGFYVLQGVVDPGTAYSVNVLTGVSQVFERPVLPYDPADFVTEQVFVTAKDDTRVPMYVVRLQETPLDGTAPGMVYGYGFNAWAGSPWFQPMVTEWMRRGGVWALANIRGGGEYGETWAAAGRRRNKQTSIDDYLAASEWLVAHHYVRPHALVANAGSAGGVIAAAAIVQRPELYGAAILDYPVIDMLRYHAIGGGARWTEEYGTVNDSADFEVLRRYSPYENVRPGTCYPPTFLAPGELDPLASPAHAYKFAAALSYANSLAPSCRSPVALRVSWGAGHSAGATPADYASNWADQLGFLSLVLSRDPR